MNYRLLCKLLGALVALFSVSILTAVPFAMWYGEWLVFGELWASTAIGLAVAGGLYLIGRNAKGEIYRREALATVGLSWIITAAIGGLPFFLTGEIPHFTDCYFESMSGLTTTGASILTSIEDKPKAILFWRSFLHFLGGLGIIVLFVAVLPMLGVGARALFKQEVPGPVPEGLTPRIKDTAMKLWKLYVGLNLIETMMLMATGMSFFDAINHAMATMATGGYSTKNTSVLGFASPAIEWIIILFMYLAGANFTLHLEATKGRFHYFRNAEFRSYTMVIVAASAFIAFLLWITGNQAVSNPHGINFRDAFFTVVSLKTTTGFGTVDFDQWPNAARMTLLILMFFGGCAGSTGGGIKVIRWVILFKVALHELAAKVSPRRVSPIKIDGHLLNKDVAREVLTFFFIYLCIALFGTVAITVLMPDHSLLSSASAVVATLNNIGPGLEAVGPTMNYATMTAPAKWLLSLFMVLGRLELYAILVLFSVNFWRRE